VTTCTIIGLIVVSCLADPAMRLTPAEAAAILEPNQFVYVDTPQPRWPLPQSGVFGSPTAGPFGEFPPFPPPHRLDGTPYTEPPWEMRAYVGRRERFPVTRATPSRRAVGPQQSPARTSAR